ncbi:MAG: RNase adapter RapZ [Gammaproteobacteria bacterium]|nr:RNase adapter RapZ [Gammaproteobacteria bacterium]MDD9874201.1 RNase adapter RapZ [Gammaproteobacteria bacterium]
MIIISGLSGSGKSVALQSLEDIGYYCIDNLPSVLLPEFGRHLQSDSGPGAEQALTDAAVSIDSRNKHFLLSLDGKLRELEQERAYRVFFLEAEERMLIRRYSETRRKHPLTDAHTPLVEGIRQERALLQPLFKRAEKVIDTTDTTPHELRRLTRDFAADDAEAGPLFLIESFGFKFGSPREADFVFDVRCLPNPHWEEKLRALSGLDQAVIDHLDAHQSARKMSDEIHRFVEKWLPDFAAENRSYLTVAIGCTGGRHRSVYIAERLRKRFARHGVKVQVHHRDLPE